MICYYTQISVNDSFNETILMNMFIEWLNTTKNKMEGLHYTVQDSFVYRLPRKELRVENFKKSHILGIQFTTSDNYKKAKFIVEIMYDYENQTLDLGFYKELNEDSKYIGALSLPLIFRQLLESEFIQKDGCLNIQNEPYFLTYTEYKQAKRQCSLPLIVLKRNQKCCVNPFKLAENVLGIAHVICIHTKQNDLSMTLLYPNGFKEEIVSKKNHLMIEDVSEKVRDYMITEHNQNYMFDELIRVQLQNEHQAGKELENEYKALYLDEIEKKKNDIAFYREIYQELQDEYNDLLIKKEELDVIIEKYQKEALLVSKKQNHAIEYDVMMEIINKSLISLADSEVYRKRDVLKSIIRSQEK